MRSRLGSHIEGARVDKAGRSKHDPAVHWAGSNERIEFGNHVKPWWLVLVMLSFACSSRTSASARDVADANDVGRRLSARNEGERELLRQLPSLPANSARRIGSANVVARAPYTAASGRTCRALLVTLPSQPASDRLACSSGHDWFFVPDVFASSPASE
jgi:hypothetical protein